MSERPRRSSRSAPAATETELKLRVPPAQWPRLLASPLLQAARAGRDIELEAVYYDTPSRALSRSRIAYRVRREGRRWVQTLKGGGSESSGLHTRIEVDALLDDAVPQPQQLPRNALTALLREVLAGETLQPVLQTRIRRHLRVITPGRGIRIEVAFDRGTISSGGRRETVSELELELKAGPVEALFDLASALVAAHGLTLEHRSKAARGYALLDTAPAQPVKAQAPVIDRTMDAAALSRAVIATTLAQVQANSHGVLCHDDPEFLHQMRVGLRRLRCALDLFAPQMAGALEHEAAALRVIGGGLGEARDWDVLIGEILPQVFAQAAPGSAAARLWLACTTVRDRARRKTNNIIKSISYSQSMLALGRHHAVLPAPVSGRSARRIAADILDACHARVLKRGKHLRRQDDEALHRLRIAVKKLRYAVEFFAGLFDASAMQAQRAALTRLQDILGHINDAAVTAPRLEQARRQFLRDGRKQQRRWPQSAAQAVLEWQQALAAAQRKKLAAAWRRFEKAPQYWR